MGYLGLAPSLGSRFTNGAIGVTEVTLATDAWSVYFDGTNDYITIPDQSYYSFGNGTTDSAFSVGLWVKINSTSNSIFLSKQTDASNGREYTVAYNGTKVEFALVDQSTSGAIYAQSTASALTVGTWHHVLVTYDGEGSETGIKIYVDAVQDNPTQAVFGSYTAMEAGSANMFIGSQTFGSFELEGRISQLSMWSSELTATEVSALYNAGTPVDPTVNGGDYVSSGNLVGSWDMENTGTTTVTDNSANSNNGTLTNGAAFDADVPVITIPTWADNRSVLLDGTNDFIDCGDIAAINSASTLTINFWLKCDPSETSLFISKYNDANNRIHIGAVSNILYFNTSNGGGQYGQVAFSSTAWNMLTLVFDGGQTGNANRLKGYINGVEQTLSFTGTIQATIANLTGDSFMLARQDSTYADCTISELCVWSSALSGANVTSLYNSGTPIDSSTIDSANVEGHWPLEAGSGITALDYSGNGNHGLLINGPLWDADTPVITIPAWSGLQSVLLDGTNDLISIPDDNVFSFGNGSTDGAFSVSAWIKIREVTGIYFPIFAKRDDGNTDYEWVFDITSAGHLRIILFSGNSSANQIYARSSDNHDAYEGAWIHVLATYDGGSDKSGLKVYRNGVNDTDFSFEFGTYVAMSNTSAPLLLGSFGTQFADGRISEMCLWSSELTAANVTSLYNSGTPIDSSTIDSANVAGHWPLEAGSGKTAIDYSGNGNHGTLTNGPTWSSDTP